MTGILDLKSQCVAIVHSLNLYINSKIFLIHNNIVLHIDLILLVMIKVLIFKLMNYIK